MGLHSVTMALAFGNPMLHGIREGNIPGGGRVPNWLLCKNAQGMLRVAG